MKNSFISAYCLMKNIPENLPESLRMALQEHRSGNYSKSLQHYAAVNFKDLPEEVREIAGADLILVKTKLGEPQDLRNPQHFRSPLASVIYHYARYTWAFWVDHKIAWSSLRKLLWLSPRSPLPGHLEMVIFLIGHMWAIAGHSRIGLFPARWAHRRMTERESKGIRHASICTGIVWAAYPYTLVVTGHLDADFDKAILIAEKGLPNEPYFITLFQISSIYGHAYTGDVVRTEIYSERLFVIHERSQLLRYKPLTRIMPLLPYALRGYARLISQKYELTLQSHKPELSDPLINSQFFRVASLIALCLGQNDRARDLIQKASRYREITRSFLIWKTFDEQILNYAQRGTPLNPEKDHLVIGRPYKKAPPQASELYREAFRLLVESPQQSERELELKMAALISDQISVKDYRLISQLPQELDEVLRLKLASSYLDFHHISPDRRAVVAELLGYISPMVLDIFQMFHELKKSQMLEREAAVGKLAAQVAHDVRSPLSALEMMIHSLDSIPIESRMIIKKAVSRIKDIANNLLAENRAKRVRTSSQALTLVKRSARGEMIWPMIESIISEKRSQYCDRSELSIEGSVLPDDLCLFGRCDPIDLSSVLSNLIDNSIEAQGSKNRIDVEVSNDTDGYIKVRVKDQGPGFPPAIVNRLGEKGLSHGKPNGNGLALARLVECVSEWSGKVVFSNSPLGAEITIYLPREPIPLWLAHQVSVPDASRLIIFDDDTSIHEIWNRRSLKALELIHCFNEDDLQRELTIDSALNSKSFFVDYELGTEESGLDLIRKYNLHKALCFLVTSHFDSTQVQRECTELNIKIIPKFSLGFVPITVRSTAYGPVA